METINSVLITLKSLRIDLGNAFNQAVQLDQIEEAKTLQEDLLKVINAIYALED